jgi:hypothetical protein
MIKISDLVEFVSGSPQFRIVETKQEHAPIYFMYSQADLNDDLTMTISTEGNNKQIQTLNEVNILYTGDIVLSLISGKAAIVRESHNGYLYTQNYLKMIPTKKLHPEFLVYLINENDTIKRQFAVGLQGSEVMKYTAKQVKELELPKLPQMKRQIIIGDIYFKQLRLNVLRKKTADLETIIMLYKLQEEVKR